MWKILSMGENVKADKETERKWMATQNEVQILKNENRNKDKLEK